MNQCLASSVRVIAQAPATQSVDFANSLPEVRSIDFAPAPVYTITLASNSALRDLSRRAGTPHSALGAPHWAFAPPRPRTISLWSQPPAPRVQSFRFRSPAESPANLAEHSAQGTVARVPPVNRRPVSPSAVDGATTRIRPPHDVIKLHDRLYYVLQPSLEALMAGDAIELPLRPFPYQLQGVAFLYPRFGAVLADEMGLGKTMQAITAIRMLLRAGELESVLLVCPKSVVTNWQREFTLWAPELPLTVIEGDQARRAWQWQLSPAPVKIANYELLVRDAAILADGRLDFDLVVLDESQRIKNRAGATSQIVRSLSRRRSWALTGTPVENSSDDLLGIFEFVAPGHLSPHMKPRAMGRQVRDYVLRRTKENVLADLPPKLVRDAEVELTPDQRETYKLAEDDGVLRLTEMGDEATIQHVFELVLRLKQICNFDPATGASSKLERLEADLEEVAASGQKAIVFSQWVDTLKRLRGELQRFHPLEYHGRIPPAQREAILDQFREEPGHHVLLMTYGAGGVGLNLQFCSYVFLFDRWWNPAVEDQAINRAHRIGTAGPVTVTRFLTLESIEERINQVLQEKRDLFDTIFSDVSAPKSLGLTGQEIFGLFNLRCPHDTIDVSAHPRDAA